MATNKHAMIRYQALDRCFQNRTKRYYFEDLLDFCNNAIYEFTGIEDGVKRRQLFDDIAFMESEQGWSIPLEKVKDGRRVFYRYEESDFSINKQPLNEEEVRQLKETLFMLKRFKGMPQFEWMNEIAARFESVFKLSGQELNVVGFEQNPYLQGLEHFSPLFNAIVNKQALRIEYKSYNKEAKWMEVHPYYLKQYNNRWFLFGHYEEMDCLTNLAIDRIVTIEPVSISYRNNDEIDFDEFFDDVIGVTIPLNEVAEKIILQVSESRLPYILSKPIHHSQINKGNGRIQLSLMINNELIYQLLSFGNDLTVLYPASLVVRIRTILADASNNYSISADRVHI